MTDAALEPTERMLEEAARAFPYPPTPRLAGAVRRRLAGERERPARRPLRVPVPVALAAVVLVAAAVAALSVWSGGREALAELLGVPSTRVRVLPESAPVPTPTPGPPYVPPTGREVSPAEAAALLRAPLRLPAYPPGAAVPERPVVLPAVTYDGGLVEGVIVVTVHRDPATDRPFVLYQARFGRSGGFVFKGLPEGVTATSVTVRGRRGLWFSGPPHVMEYHRKDGRPVAGTEHLVTGALNWEEDGISYRLEIDLPLEEALRVAESLR